MGSSVTVATDEPRVLSTGEQLGTKGDEQLARLGGGSSRQCVIGGRR
jgi:hypothetical protein